MEVKGEKLEIGYDGRIVVREMDITVKKGEITTIIGPNGSGKSTLLKALTRLLRCSMGCVYLNQEDLYNIDRKKLAKAEAWYGKYGRWSLLLSWAPFVGDPITLVAGILREPFSSFIAIVAVAKTVRYLVVALITLQFA